MAMMPKRVKYRKEQRGRIKGVAHRGNVVQFGDFGLQALSPGWLTGKQIEAGRIAANHYLAHEGKVWVRAFPSKPISAKPAETRMGKGKGEPDVYVAVVKTGTILYEIGGVPEETARVALNRAAHKMPLKVRLVRRRHKL